MTLKSRHRASDAGFSLMIPNLIDPREPSETADATRLRRDGVLVRAQPARVQRLQYPPALKFTRSGMQKPDHCAMIKHRTAAG